MAFNGKSTTILDIIERVRRTGISDFTEEEAKEWAWEVISLLGVPSFYVDKVATLLVENARATLPYDLYDMSEGGIRDYYTKIVLRKESDIFYDRERVGTGDNATNLNFEGQSVVYVDGLPTTLGDGYLSAVPKQVFQKQEYTYKFLNDGFISTGFKDGVIEVAYKAFPVDNDGGPLINDDFKTIRAVVEYIKKQVVYRMWLREEISNQVKQQVDKDCSFAIASARSNASIGSVDEWEAIRARTMRMVRDPNMARVGFRGYGYGEGLDMNSPRIR